MKELRLERALLELVAEELERALLELVAEEKVDPEPVRQPAKRRATAAMARLESQRCERAVLTVGFERPQPFALSSRGRPGEGGIGLQWAGSSPAALVGRGCSLVCSWLWLPPVDWVRKSGEVHPPRCLMCPQMGS